MHLISPTPLPRILSHLLHTRDAIALHWSPRVACLGVWRLFRTLKREKLLAAMIRSSYHAMLLFWLTLCAMAFSQNAFKSSIFVDPTSGEDSGACGTAAAPCATLDWALHAAGAPAAITLRAGVYGGLGNVDVDFGGRRDLVVAADAAAPAGAVVVNCTGGSRGFVLAGGERNVTLVCRAGRRAGGARAVAAAWGQEVIDGVAGGAGGGEGREGKGEGVCVCAARRGPCPLARRGACVCCFVGALAWRRHGCCGALR